jgi:hypothetical protein
MREGTSMVQARQVVSAHWLSALAALALALASCAGPAATPSPSASPTVSPTPIDTGTPFPTDDGFAELVRRVSGGGDPASGELDELWRHIAAQAFVAGQGPYETPARVLGYRGSFESPPTPCAEGYPQRIWQRNGLYCATDRSIYFDEEWLREFAATFSEEAPGDATNFAAVAILAHEWGHHIQAEAGITGESIALELQADCFAGIVLGTSENVTDGRYRLEDDDLAAGLAAFFEIGNRDYRASEWMAADEHGSQVQRLMAFATGYQGSLGAIDEGEPLASGYPWCYGYRDYRPGQHVTLGPYQLLPLPGRAAADVDGWHQIEPQAGTAYATPAARLRWLDSLPLPAGASLLEQLAAAAEDALPGLSLLYDPLPELGHGSGEMMAHYFERALPPAEGGGWQSGVVALIEPTDTAGGLLMVAYRPLRAPTDPVDRADLVRVFEELATLGLLGYRLCGPGESGEFGGATFNSACVDDL